jgi:hypothetical protein
MGRLCDWNLDDVEMYSENNGQAVKLVDHHTLYLSRLTPLTTLVFAASHVCTQPAHVLLLRKARGTSQ